MKTTNLRPLAKGQVWKTRLAHIEIIGLGKRRIHYRVKQLGSRQVSAQISGIGAMENYLRMNRACLAGKASCN